MIPTMPTLSTKDGLVAANPENAAAAPAGALLFSKLLFAFKPGAALPDGAFALPDAATGDAADAAPEQDGTPDQPDSSAALVPGALALFQAPVVPSAPAPTSTTAEPDATPTATAPAPSALFAAPAVPGKAAPAKALPPVADATEMKPNTEADPNAAIKPAPAAPAAAATAQAGVVASAVAQPRTSFESALQRHMPGEGSALPQPAAKLLDALLGPRDEAAQEATATAPRPMPVTSFGSVAPQPLPAAVSAEAVAGPEPGFVAVEHELDLAQESQWLDRLARDIARTAGGEGKLHFQLKPEHLGALTVEMSQGSAGTSVRMTADSEAARALIADAQPRLIAEARAQGARIASTHVDVGAHGHMASDGRHQREPAQHQARPGRGQIKTDVTEQPRRWLNASDRYA